MKRLLALSILALASCSNASLASSSDAFSSPNEDSLDVSSASASDEIEFEPGSKVIFSEFYVGDSVRQRAVEISNYGTEAVDLSEYEIACFHGDAKAPEYRFSLSGTLQGNSAYVVRYSESDTILHYDLSTPSFVSDGSWPVALLHLGKAADVLGRIGDQLEFAFDDFVRKNEYRIGREHSELYDWIAYGQNDQSNLGNPSCPLSEAEILEGPKLTQSDLDAPYVLSGTELGGGGAKEVKLGYVGDGDTTTFTGLPSDLVRLGYSGDSFRYQNIDTPEIDHGSSISAGPWGYAAKYWNNDILRNAKHILIQSVRNASITETYGRLIGYVWYSNLTNPKPEDYINLNHQTILMGYSKVAFGSEKSLRMLSRGIPYYRYFEDANYRGLRDGYKVFGEKDPDFAY